MLHKEDAASARGLQRLGIRGSFAHHPRARIPVSEPDSSLLSLNTATRARAVEAAGDHRRAARVTASAASRPGATRWRRSGLKDTAQRIRDAGLDVSRLLPRRHVPGASTATGRRAALDDNQRAVDEALTVGARCLVLVVGGLPKDRDGRIRVEGPGRRARQWCATASASCSSTRGRPACRSRSSRCIRCTRRTAPASTRWRTRTTCATSCGARSRHRGRRLSRLVGPAAQARDRARRRRFAIAPARVPHLRLAGADDRSAERPRHDGRRRHRPAAASARGWKPAAIAACTRSRSSPTATGGSAIPTRCSPPARRAIANA